jgi:hypothetical protein
MSEALGQAEDGEQRGRGDGGDGEARGEDVDSDDVPERSEDDVGEGRMGVGEVRDELAGAEEVERGGDVVAAFVPEVGELEESEMAERYGKEEEGEEAVRGKCG